jgi:hypothetical protein
MGELRIMGKAGDTVIEWDPEDAEQSERAREEFKRLKDEGFEFYEVENARGKRVKRFSPKLGKVIAAPGTKTKADKKTGKRPKAMAGGPNARMTTSPHRVVGAAIHRTGLVRSAR